MIITLLGFAFFFLWAYSNHSAYYLDKFYENLSNPDLVRCALYECGCPDGFQTRYSSNWTSSRCIPLSYNDAQKATRDRQIND